MSFRDSFVSQISGNNDYEISNSSLIRQQQQQQFAQRQNQQMLYNTNKSINENSPPPGQAPPPTLPPAYENAPIGGMRLKYGFLYLFVFSWSSWITIADRRHSANDQSDVVNAWNKSETA